MTGIETVGLTPETLHLAPCDEPYEFVPVAGSEEEDYRQHLLIDVVHDGEAIPDDRRLAGLGKLLADAERRPELLADHARERDWGAECVARELARALEAPGYWRVTIARGLLDFNCFPGVSRRPTRHPERYAMRPPWTTFLEPADVREVLEYYDRIAERLRDVCELKVKRGNELRKLDPLRSQFVRLAVHTFEADSTSGRTGPTLRVLHRLEARDPESDPAAEAFDPVYPEALAESSADPRLAYRIGLAARPDETGISVDFPDELAPGSIESRLRVWLFMRHLQEQFMVDPETAPYWERMQTVPQRGRAAWDLVWEMLRGTSNRSVEAAALSNYLHRYGQRGPHLAETFLHECAAVWREVRNFRDRHLPELLRGFGQAAGLPGSLAVECDRAFLCRGRRPDSSYHEVDVGRARAVAEVLARGIREWRREDLGWRQ